MIRRSRKGRRLTGDRKDAPVSYITGLEDGSQAGYKYFDMTNTRHLSVVSRGAGGKLEILNGESGEAVAEILLSQSDDWAVSETDLCLNGLLRRGQILQFRVVHCSFAIKERAVLIF